MGASDLVIAPEASITILHLVLAGRSGREILFLLVSAFAAGLARGFSGFGAALIFVPLASSVVGPQLAAPLLLIVDAIASIGLVPGAWEKSDRRAVATMAAGAIVGVPVGAFVLASVNPIVIRWAIVGVVAALLALLTSGWRYKGRPSAGLSVVVGGISGLFSGVAQIGGPPVVAYWLGGGHSRAIVRANIVLFFVISSVISIASYLASGLLTETALALSLTATPCYGLGLALGSLAFRRAGEAMFRRVCLALIAVGAVISLPILDSVLR
jgi:hypothetical protein